MIISHKNRYLFLEIPLTGSWAIRSELIRHYDGEAVLHKHASFIEFARVATADELSYFKFATVRNPLDAAVSEFFKIKENHKGVFTDKHALSTMKTIDYAELAAYRNIQRFQPTFESFFMSPRLWNRPYSSMLDISSKQLDYVMRFENLSDEFSKVLGILGISPVRPVPLRNRTSGRKANWESYFSAQMIEPTKQIYGPFMERWSYPLPRHWGPSKVSDFQKLQYRLSIIMKRIYLTRFRYNDSLFSRLVRIVNATLKTRLYR